MTPNRVLVLCPREFGCLPKFRRKLEVILSRLDRFELAYFDDPRGFVEAQRQDPRCEGVLQISSLEDVTHAIIFDDGEEFAAQASEIRGRGIPCREIKIKITRVINVRKDDQFAKQKSTATYEYIGRGSEWGNPYSMFDGSDEGLDSREEVIRKYAYDFHRGLLRKSKEDAERLAGKRLGCFCKPEACHGDVIAEYLNSHDDGL